MLHISTSWLADTHTHTHTQAHTLSSSLFSTNLHTGQSVCGAVRGPRTLRRCSETFAVYKKKSSQNAHNMCFLCT